MATSPEAGGQLMSECPKWPRARMAEFSGSQHYAGAPASSEPEARSAGRQCESEEDEGLE